MSRKTATDLDVPPQVAARLVRLDQGKGNYSARDPSTHWFELTSVLIGNGTDVGAGFMVDGDTVAVPVPWKPPVVEAEVAENDANTGDPKETARQRTRDFLARTMQTDRVELSTLIGQVQHEFGVAKTAARNRVMKAVKEGHETALAQVKNVLYHLTIEREEPSPPNPVFVVRTIVGADKEDSEPGEVTPAIADKAAASEHTRDAAEGDAGCTEVDAVADLVPA
jgi:hypothetical protein